MINVKKKINTRRVKFARKSGLSYAHISHIYASSLLSWIQYSRFKELGLILLRHWIKKISGFQLAFIRFRIHSVFKNFHSGERIQKVADSHAGFTGYVWTEAVSGKILLRIKKYPDTCERGLKLVSKWVWRIGTRISGWKLPTEKNGLLFQTFRWPRSSATTRKVLFRLLFN